MSSPSSGQMYFKRGSQDIFESNLASSLRITAALRRRILIRRWQVRSHLHRRRNSIPEIRRPSHHRRMRNRLQQFMQPRLHMSFESFESLQRVLAVFGRFNFRLNNAGLDGYESGDDSIVGFSGVEELEVVLFQIRLAVVGD